VIMNMNGMVAKLARHAKFQIQVVKKDHRANSLPGESGLCLLNAAKHQDDKWVCR
jgi:hypothetical protein